MGWNEACFVGAALLAVAGWRWSSAAARRRPQQAWAIALVALATIAWWAWLLHHPAVAVRALPTAALSRLEGAAPLPLLAVALGAMWARATIQRQRWVIAAALVLGVAHFVHGAGWMVKPTPASAMAQRPTRGPAYQSEDYSCVAAACATALTRLGVPTSEGEMARLSGTSPGSGATVVRALYALQQRLATTPFTVELFQPTPAELTRLPTPMLALVAAGPLQRHMVVLDHVTAERVLMTDPVGGQVLITAEDFAQQFAGVVLVFPLR